VAIGASTNVFLHLLAIAREAQVPLNLEQIERISSRTLFLCDVKPSGRRSLIAVEPAEAYPQC